MALIQEITTNDLPPLHGYTAYVNEGTDKRGTAILLKEGLCMQNVKRLPSGRGIAGLFKDTWIVIIYAPSGAEKRQERDAFFTHDLAHLLPTSTSDLLMAGDFNCVTSPSDCTGTPNVCKALTSIITGLGLQDIYDTRQPQPLFTHYTNKGATRIDRIYFTDTLRERIQGADTIVAPFSDH